MRLRCLLPRLGTTAGLVLAGLAAGGCSIPLDTMFAKADADVEQTGSTAAADVRARPATETAMLPEVDLAYARAVAGEALARGGRDSSFPWANPHTGAGGNITPLAVSYNDGALVCRDFLASYVHGPEQAWLQGEACRSRSGQWEVKSLKPLRQG